MAYYIGLVTYILSTIGAYQFETATPTPEPTATRIPNTSTPKPRPTNTIQPRVIATATPRPAPTNASQPRQPTTGQVVTATRYGTSFNGKTMGCGGVYSSGNPNILAVPPTRYASIPCGTRVILTNPKTGLSLSVVRTDACPGCGHNHVDLSEAGIAALCGGPCDIINGLIMTIP